MTDQTDQARKNDKKLAKAEAKAAKKAGRATAEGLIGSYIHAGGKIGVLVEVNCETDFVARTDEFKSFVNDLAMQVAAASPRWVKSEDVDQTEIDKEREIYRQQMLDQGSGGSIVNTASFVAVRRTPYSPVAA